MEMTELAQPRDSARFFAAEAVTLKASAAKTMSATAETRMMRRLLMASPRACPRFVQAHVSAS